MLHPKLRNETTMNTPKNTWLSYLLPTRAGIPVLMYHRVEEVSTNSLTVATRDFEAQLQYLKSAGYASISITQFLAQITEGLAREKLPKKPVLITFDDGYACTLKTAAPLLEKHNFKAALFVTSEFIERGSEANPHYLTKTELAEFAGRGHELALHSHAHPNYQSTSLPEILKDLKLNQQWLAKQNVPHVPALAYPFGARPKDKSDQSRLKSDLKAMGIQAAFRIGNRVASWSLLQNPNLDAYDLPRIDIRGDDTLQTFQIKIQKGRIRPFQ
jgi:peptidoglycan/xylan/chitin deacetylase (PgdA/CDA1 family)